MKYWQIFSEITKYKDWAEKLMRQGYEYGRGEWESEYDDWEAIRGEFKNMIHSSSHDEYTEEELHELLYILARDNEDEGLADIISENEEWLICFCEESFFSGENDAKWQLAVRIKYIHDRNTAEEFLKRYASDKNEYVQRRASIELAELPPEA